MRGNPLKFDVAVVGAGPSGSWTATLLARRGARVALFDPSHPREKPCGGGITGRALALVSDAAGLEGLHAVRIESARFVDVRLNRSAVVPLDQSRDALLVASRTEFDQHLYDSARAAGAVPFTSRVSRVASSPAGFDVECADGSRASCGFLVAADGANSFVRRSVAAPFRRDQLSIATGYFAAGVSSAEIVIEMLSEPAGYIWSFPRPNHLAIGICAQADAGIGAERLRALVRRWIDDSGIAPDARLIPYSWPIPSLSPRDIRALPLAGARWLSVGDAAGLVDPITREGIFFALQSAVFAAHALSSSSPEPSRQFTARVRDELAGELERAARYKAGFFRPRFTRLMIDALRESASVRAVMADLVAGTQSYRTLKWRLARTFEVGLAWRLLTTGG